MREFRRRLWQLLTAALVLGILLLALWALNRELSAYRWQDIRRSIAEIPPARVALAIALTLLNYLLLTTYDLLSLIYLKRPLPLRRVALASFIGYAASFNLGPLLGGSTVRYRLYTGWGLTAFEVMKLLAFGGITFWLGVGALAALALTIGAPPFPAQWSWMQTWAPIVGAISAGAVVGYVLLCACYRHPVRVHRWSVPLPSARLAMAQVAAGLADLVLAAAVLWVLLPQRTPIGYLSFAGLFVLSQAAGMSSHVPGGVGVFEAVLLIFTSDEVNEAALAGSLLAFRVIYYLLPLAVAIALFVLREVAWRRGRTQARAKGAPHALPAQTLEHET